MKCILPSTKKTGVSRTTPAPPFGRDRQHFVPIDSCKDVVQYTNPRQAVPESSISIFSLDTNGDISDDSQNNHRFVFPHRKMRLFTIILGIVFSFSGFAAAQDFGFDLLSQPQMQTPGERLKVQSPPVSYSETATQWEMNEKPIGALLLKTGQLYIGEAILEKNIYHVVGAVGKPKVSAHKVEYAGTDRNDIYQYKRNKPDTASREGTYSLAKWCVSNKMYDEAIVEFQNCKSYVSYPQEIKLLDREISAVEEIKRNALKRAGAENAVIETIRDHASANTLDDSFDLKSWRTAVDPMVLEKFKKDVQPQLLRHCGATDCHGSNSEQEFRLTQLRQKYSTAETTLRNLKATFDQLDFRQPASSPLLTYPQKDHGGAKAIYVRQTKSQLTPIYQWTQLIPNTMPDFVDKYLAQKREAEQGEYSPIRSHPKPLEYRPIEQVSYEQSLPATSGFSFFGKDHSVEQRVELTPSTNGFHLQPKPQQLPAVTDAVETDEPLVIPAKTDPRQYRKPMPIQAKDPFDPNLFNQRYHERG